MCVPVAPAATAMVPLRFSAPSPPDFAAPGAGGFDFVRQSIIASVGDAHRLHSLALSRIGGLYGP